MKKNNQFCLLMKVKNWNQLNIIQIQLNQILQQKIINLINKNNHKNNKNNLTCKLF